MLAGQGVPNACGLKCLRARRGLMVFWMAVGSFGQSAYGQLWFSEVSTSAGVVADHTPAVNLLTSLYNVAPETSGGVTGDFNNDGLQDLFVLTSGGSPDKLFMNNGDSTFTDRAATAGLATPHMGIGAAVGDYNNDGWLDIYVTS